VNLFFLLGWNRIKHNDSQAIIIDIKHVRRKGDAAIMTVALLLIDFNAHFS